MSRLTLCFLFVSFLNAGAGNELPLAAQQLPAGPPEAQGEWIARKTEDRETGRDARLAMRMRLFDRQGRVRERALTLLALRGRDSLSGAQKKSPAPFSGDRTLIRFTAPADIKGTAFLVWEHPNADDERFLFLPALGRARRIASDETQGSFVGSDFTYEDIGGREFESYAYRLLDDRATWTAGDGSTHPVYTLESRSRDANARFPRVVSLVRQDNFVIVKADIYNKRDEIQKTYEVRRLEKTDGYWTALEMRMADLLARTSTELVMERVEYDVGLTAEHFSRRELERGGG
jgi:hypothetical protein